MKFWRRKKEKHKEKEKEIKDKEKATKCFLKNGSMFLEQLITDCNGISNPIRMFSFDQIFKATNHFDPESSLPHDSLLFTWYKGVVTEGRSYAIKELTEPWSEKDKRVYNDIVLSARVSNHNGFIKLMGCCLEFQHPVLVFEDLEYTSLNELGSLGSKDAPVVLPWNVRLKIAKEVATAITYLHTAFPRIIIHRNIKPWNVFLDKNGTAKLTDFSDAVTLPKGKSLVEVNAIIRVDGYTDRTYSSTYMLTEYADVYSFGVFMLVLLMGRPPLLNGPDGRIYFASNILDYAKCLQERGEPVEFGGVSNDMRRPSQMKMFLDLAVRCCQERNEDRPKMIMVAKQIKLIEQASLEDGQI